MDRRSAVHRIVAASAGSALTNWYARLALAEEDFKLRSDVVLVMLDVSVKDRQGRFVPGLNKQDFTVLENGKRQNIIAFDSEDRPVTVGIVLDESLSMAPKRRDVIASAEALIAESNPQDEIFVVHFSEEVTLGLPSGVPFSGNLQQLRSALIRANPGGKTALHDAVIKGLDHLRLGQKDKKTLVLVSDGGDTASKHNRKQVLEAVQASSATIYTIGIFDPDDPDRQPGFLHQLADMSGGEAYFPQSADELGPICRKIAREIRTRYSVGYRPETDQASSPLRHIRVEATSHGHGRLFVRTRNAYRYESTPATNTPDAN